MIENVLTFWFNEHGTKQWWQKDAAFDTLCRERFAELHHQACLAELFSWREGPEGRLAEIILLDQLSRNLYRDAPQAFAQDSMALALAQEAVRVGADRELEQQQRQFLYMPYMHSESRIIHQQAVSLFADLGNESSLEFEYKHKRIIDQFGRYPHRNKVLGRTSSAEELAFLQQPNSSF